MVVAFKHRLKRDHLSAVRLCRMGAGSRHAVCLEQGLLLRVQGGVAGHLRVICQD